MVVRIWVKQRELLVITNFKEAEGSPAKQGTTGQNQEGRQSFCSLAPRPDFRIKTDVVCVPCKEVNSRKLLSRQCQMPRYLD